MSTRESAKAILVNDDPLQLRLAAAVLEKDGLKVLACQSAEEALRVMRDQGAPDVIVTDLHMPGIDGWRLCRLLRSAEYKAFNKTPILVISATFSGADAEEVTSELGANGFLSIPYEPSTLCACVRSLLDGKTPATSLRALIIEDSPTLARLLRRAFEAHGYAVCVAETGGEALRLLRERSPDVVVIDYHLPDITGDAILPEVKRPGSAAVAVVITADPSTELATRLTQMGADGYIRKPFDPDHLIDLCEKARRARALLRVEELLEERTRQLRQSQERLRSLFEGIPEAVIVHDDKGVILHANEVAARWLSWPAGGLDGRSLRQIVAPEYVSALPGQLRGAIADGACAFETTMISRTGRRIAVEVNERPIIFEDKRAILGVARDVTERKRAEREMQSLLQLHQNTLTTMPSALIVLNAGLNIIMANRRYLEAWGFEEAQVIGRNIADVFPASLICEQQLLQRIEAVRAGGAPDLLLGVPHRANGHADKYLNIRICGLPAASGEEEAPGALLVIDDVTQQRRMEEQIRQSVKMESIGILAGGVAHDFNNLLTGIIGYTQLLHRKARQDPNITRDLAQIRELADRAAGLTRQLLAFSRRQTLDPIVLNINSLVDNASKMLKRIIGEDIVLEVLAAPDLGAVRADPGQVEQVLLNLAVNARDAMPKGGKLTIETNNVQLDHKYAQHRADAKPGPYVVISVSDTGCGMDQQTLDHIFEPFFTTKEPGKGTGLGLSTVYGIVTQHGGHISAGSAVRVGTTFRIYLPRVAAELSPEALDEEEAGPPEGGERILLVEDEPTVRRLVQHVLQDSGYTVAAAPCPSDAEKIFAEHAGDFDMLLTDVVMPGESGKDLYEKLAKADPSLKILYMSGYIDTAMVRRGILSRDAAFIQKPFTPEALVQKVRGVLDGGAAGYRKDRTRRTRARHST